jgi:hypothetical protein
MTVAELITRLEACRLDAVVLVDRYSDYATPGTVLIGHAAPINGGEWYRRVGRAASEDHDAVPIVYVGWR